MGGVVVRGEGGNASGSPSCWNSWGEWERSSFIYSVLSSSPSIHFPFHSLSTPIFSTHTTITLRSHSQPPSSHLTMIHSSSNSPSSFHKALQHLLLLPSNVFFYTGRPLDVEPFDRSTTIYLTTGCLNDGAEDCYDSPFFIFYLGRSR